MIEDDFFKLTSFIKTPSLWNGSLAGIKQFPLSDLNLSHLSNQNLFSEFPVIPENIVLGKRAEYYYQYCIEQSSNYDLIASNIQINVARITKGEIDYIIKEIKTGKILHVELVYKFYCYNPQISEKSNVLNPAKSLELSKLVGPNKRDNFVFKFDRLVSHQLPLLHSPAAVKTLSSYNFDLDNIEQRVCFLAHIYIPRELWQHEFKYINKRCIAGYYLNYDAFAKAYTDNIYFIPEKHQWIGNCQALPISYNYIQTVKIVKESIARNFAPMIWMQLENGQFESFFVIA